VTIHADESTGPKKIRTVTTSTLLYPEDHSNSVCTSSMIGKLVQPVADAILDQRQALLIPSLVALGSLALSFKDRRLYRVERG
jgi:hypothetical protein